MKIFLDTADVATVEKAYATGLIDGWIDNKPHSNDEEW